MSAVEMLQGRRVRGGGRTFGSPVMAIVAGIAVAAVMFVIVSAIAAPSGARERLKAATAQVGVMETTMAEAHGFSSYPAGSICRSQEEGVALVRRRLQDAASSSGISLTDFSATRGQGNEATGLTPISFSFGAQAQYDVLLNFLGGLAAGRPEIVVDTADLTPATSVASLRLSGRVLCWTTARR